MRLFIAAELPDALLDALAETSASLRSSVRGRFVAPDSFHVTLAFLGDVEGGRLPAVEEALERACAGQRAIPVALGELGSFGRISKATLWQAVSHDGALSGLARAIRENLRSEGLSFDEKAFRAHVTLMRAANLAECTLPPACLADGITDAVTLFRSDLSGPRPAYEPLHTVLLP